MLLSEHADWLVEFLDKIFELTLVLNQTTDLKGASLECILQLNVLLVDNLLASLWLDDFLACVLYLNHARVNSLCPIDCRGRASQITSELFDDQRLVLDSLIEFLQSLLSVLSDGSFRLCFFKFTCLAHHSFLILSQFFVLLLHFRIILGDETLKALHLQGEAVLCILYISLGRLRRGQFFVDLLQVFWCLGVTGIDCPKLTFLNLLFPNLEGYLVFQILYLGFKLQNLAHFLTYGLLFFLYFTPHADGQVLLLA